MLFPPPRIKAIQTVREVWLDTSSLFYAPARLRAPLANVSGACCRNTMKSNFIDNSSGSANFSWSEGRDLGKTCLPPGESALGKGGKSFGLLNQPYRDNCFLFCLTVHTTFSYFSFLQTKLKKQTNKKSHKKNPKPTVQAAESFFESLVRKSSWSFITWSNFSLVYFFFLMSSNILLYTVSSLTKITSVHVQLLLSLSSSAHLYIILCISRTFSLPSILWLDIWEAVLTAWHFPFFIISRIILYSDAFQESESFLHFCVRKHPWTSISTALWIHSLACTRGLMGTTREHPCYLKSVHSMKNCSNES